MNTPGLARLHLRFEAEALRLRLSLTSTVFVDAVLNQEGRQRLATAVAAYVLTLDENPLAGHPERLAPGHWRRSHAALPRRRSWAGDAPRPWQSSQR